MILTGLAVGIIFGAILQRGRFCVTGMMRDIFLQRSWRGMTALLILISVHSIGLTLFTQLGVISPKIGNFAPIGVIVGGFIFGLGIVLAGGCASGTWYRSGEGLVGSWVALAFYGLSAAAMKYGFLHPVNSALKSWKLPVTTIPKALGISPWILVIITVGSTAALWRYYAIKDASKPVYVVNQPWYNRPLNMNLAGALVGVVATVGFITSSASGRNGGLSITTPSADLVTYTATADPQRLNWGTLLVVGLLIGSFLTAKATGEFRVRVPDAQTIVRAIFGGIFMGVGASLAGGCTVGNGMVETSLFSFQGWIALIFMTLGVGAGTRLWVTSNKNKLVTTPVDSLQASPGISIANEPTFSIPQATGAVALATKPAVNTLTKVDEKTYALNTLGSVCPFPLIEAKQAIAQLNPGDALIIDFDCTQATDSIPGWAREEGHSITDFARTTDAGWQITVIKG